MAGASAISQDALAWTSRWYLRQGTWRAANTWLVNTHYAHPLAALWGGGTLSSSDGQRFPQHGRSLTARALSRYFGFPVTDQDAAHLTPAQHEHISFYGNYSFDIDAELSRDGHQPLRQPDFRILGRGNNQIRSAA